MGTVERLSYDQQGFVIGRQLLGDAEFGELRENLDRYVREVDAENGCLRYVAGSHQRGFQTHAKSKILGFSQRITDDSHEDFTREVAVPLQPGDAVAHHGMTIHRADANLSFTDE